MMRQLFKRTRAVRSSFQKRCRALLVFVAAALAAAVCHAGQGSLEQFDVFLGYGDVVPEASWFPIVCEIKNNGPAFNGIVEISGGTLNQGQARRAIVELPTGTLKRITIPVFSTTRGYSSWDVRLLDDRGRVRAEQNGLRPRKQVAAGTPVLGALS